MESGALIENANETTIHPIALLIHIFFYLPNDLFFNDEKHKRNYAMGRRIPYFGLEKPWEVSNSLKI